MRALEGAKRLGFDVPFWGMSLVRIRLVISLRSEDQGREADTAQKQGMALGAQDDAKKIAPGKLRAWSGQGWRTRSWD